MPIKLLLLLSLCATALPTQAEGLATDPDSRFLDDGRGCNASPYFRAIYPMTSKRLDEQGVAYVRIKTTPKGVAELIELAHSSGYQRLDEAAVKWARERCYDVNGDDQDIDKVAKVIPVRFKLIEEESKTPSVRLGNY